MLNDEQLRILNNRAISTKHFILQLSDLMNSNAEGFFGEFSLLLHCHILRPNFTTIWSNVQFEELFHICDEIYQKYGIFRHYQSWLEGDNEEDKEFELINLTLAVRKELAELSTLFEHGIKNFERVIEGGY